MINSMNERLVTMTETNDMTLNNLIGSHEAKA